MLSVDSSSKTVDISGFSPSPQWWFPPPYRKDEVSEVEYKLEADEELPEAPM
jgi:hypothetical protein